MYDLRLSSDNPSESPMMHQILYYRKNGLKNTGLIISLFMKPMNQTGSKEHNESKITKPNWYRN